MANYAFASDPGAADGPLLFLFHGTGGNGEMLKLGREVAPTATLIAPRGDVLEEGAARFFRSTGDGVYDPDDLARATAKMAGFVERQRQVLGRQPVFGLGYWNGADILASVLFSRPELFDATVLMHPLIPFEPDIRGRLAGKPVLITAGRRDPICPPEITARLDAWLRDAGANVTLDWNDGGHELRDTETEAARALFAACTREKRVDIAIEREDGPGRGRYVVREPGGSEAEMTYTKVGQHRITIDHTGVPDAFRGQGIGAKLVMRAVEDARASGTKIVPICPFARAQFERHPDWADVMER